MRTQIHLGPLSAFTQDQLTGSLLLDTHRNGPGSREPSSNGTGRADHKRPYVGASQARSWSPLLVLGAILWVFIAKT